MNKPKARKQTITKVKTTTLLIRLPTRKGPNVVIRTEGGGGFTPEPRGKIRPLGSEEGISTRTIIVVVTAGVNKHHALGVQ